MNKTIISILWRSFATRSAVGVRGRRSISKDISDSANPDNVNYDPDDLDEYEGNFMNLDEAHIMHEKEEYNKQKLLERRICRSQILRQENNQSFLTHVEKIQIRELHKNDPNEWTVEKLSNSFPVLPDAVEKLIKCRWQPTSAWRVVRSDKNVDENWKLFREGKLPVSYELKKHLTKFMDRKISSVGREELAAEFVRPKFKVPQPSNRSFRDLGEAFLGDSEYKVSNTKLLGNESNVREGTNSELARCKNIKRMIQSNQHGKRPMKFDEFIEQKMDQLGCEPTVSKSELFETFKENVQEPMTHEKYMLEHCSSVNNKSTELTQTPVCNALSVPESTDLNFQNTSESSSLSTFIKEKKIKVNVEVDYTLCIKIPKNLYKKGMTYRIDDCYYDDDGQFLFRVL